ncbi:MAG TPA: diguanylate cyclase [Rhodanobacter sp.]
MVVLEDGQGMESGEQGQPGDLRERFYQSVAETLTLLHPAPGHDSRRALLDVARTLASTMELPLVWIGRRCLGQSRLEIFAAGPEAEYASSLRVSDDPNELAGQGPAGMVLREGRARLAMVDAPEYALTLEGARNRGFGSIILAASGTGDGGQLALAVYSRRGGPALSDELLDWAQRLADELGRFWDDQALLQRNLRVGRYRDAHRTIQRAMLGQLEPVAIYEALANTLGEITDAAAVVVYVPEDDVLRRVVLVGELALAMDAISEPPVQADGPSIRTPTLAFMEGVPVVRLRPATHPDVSQAWHSEPLANVGAIGAWPIFSALDIETSPARRPAAVLLVAAADIDAFDADMRQLLDEIADTVGLALRQHGHRQALLLEQERQTYLALHDSLTDLPNRRALDYHLERALARATRHQRVVAVGMLDLDDLKPINDRYGHATGDRVLIEVAGRLHRALRSEDSVARLGGDEFVLVFEDLVGEGDLDALLERLWQSLSEPIVIGDSTIQIGVSLGIALYPTHAHASGEQLLRLADQAMYRVKSHKLNRSSWWAMARSEMAAEASAGTADTIEPHGMQASEMLQPCVDAWRAQLPGAVERTGTALRMHQGIAAILGSFPPEAPGALESRVSRLLQTLIYPDLKLDDQQAGAIRAGVCQAACGVDEVWLPGAFDSLRDILMDAFGQGARAHRPAMAIVLQRLALERQWQLDGMRDLQRRRSAVAATVNAVAWSSDDYLQLLEGVVKALSAHEEVALCAVGRPDAAGELIHELVAGAVPIEQLRMTNRGVIPPILIKDAGAEPDDPVRRAWRTGEIQRCAHYGSDPAMALWRDAALRHGVASLVAIPLCRAPGQPLAILSLYSPYAGAFQGESQQNFVGQIKSVLEFALRRLAPRRQLATLMPAYVRERWRAIIAGGALRMHYQPMVRLADRQVAGFEALARLRDDVGTMLLPANFLPALGAPGLMRLFRDGMIQAVACRQSLARTGLILGMSVNVPVVALQDPRYARTAEAVLQASGCPVGALRFEALDSTLGAGGWSLLAQSGVQSFTSLDLRPVEDEVALSRSLLARLCQSPFDRIKIDPAIISQVRQDPLGTLRFMRQLIRVGHDLDLEVVVEGLESRGMLESAAILGADFGQGFALARPMPAEALPRWLADFDQAAQLAFPGTALGALAGALRWDERFVGLCDEPYSRDRHAQSPGLAGEYLRRSSHIPAALRDSHDAMHAAAAGGPFDREYGRQRDLFFSLLVERALAEEQHRHEAG